MAGWGLKGNVLIACNCDWGCPCNFNARPSHGHCEGGWIWAIEEGHVDMSALTAWRGAVCRLARSDPRGRGTRRGLHRRARRPAATSRADGPLRGELGGPWGLFMKTYELGGPMQPDSN